jgi:tetratricopeptide (TPR) repeat protein
LPEDETEFDTMARTLSHIARCATLILVATLASLASSHVRAENEVELTPPAGEVENPFRASRLHKQEQGSTPKVEEPTIPGEPASESEGPKPKPEEPAVERPAKPQESPPEPQIIHRPPITYQNPFAGMSKLPPNDASLRPGPITRWKRPAIQHEEHSPIKSAVLSSEAADATATATILSPLDAIRFPPKPLTQPSSLAAPSCVLRPNSVDSPTLSAAFNEPIAAVSMAQQSAIIVPALAPPLFPAITPAAPPAPAAQPAPTSTPVAEDAGAHVASTEVNDATRPTAPTPLPDAVRLTPKSLLQPSSLTSQSVLRPNGADPPTLSAAFTQPIAVNLGQQAHAAAPAAEHAAEHAASIASAFDVDLTKFVSAPPADAPPIATESTETADSWYKQAQHAASNANSCDDFSAVIELCERGMRSEPDEKLSASLRRLSAWAHNRRGELHDDAGEADASLSDFQAAIALDPNCSLAIHNRAVSLAQQSQYEAALRDFNRVIELNPGLAVAYRNRAELLAAIGRMDEAVADYSHAIEGLPDNPQLYRGRAYANQRLGHFHEASADLNRALDIDPNEAEALTQRGNLAAEQGDFAQAAKSFQRAIAAAPNGPDAHRSLAWLLATCPDPEVYNPQQAVAVAVQAVKLSPDGDYLVLDTLATARASAGQFKQAIEIEQKAVAAAPPELALALKQRLDFYHRGIAYRPATSRVRRVSHESPVDSSSTEIESR